MHCAVPVSSVSETYLLLSFMCSLSFSKSYCLFKISDESLVSASASACFPVELLRNGKKMSNSNSNIPLYSHVHMWNGWAIVAAIRGIYGYS